MLLYFWVFLVSIMIKVYIIIVLAIHVGAINRSVYKVSVTQKGFAQFLEYNLEIPPIREFTLCTWIRVFNLDSPQTIFTYFHGTNNIRIVKLWLDEGGSHLVATINDNTASAVPVEWKKDIWRHVCISYQSDYGAWAIYIDGILEQCESSAKLYGYVLPGQGSIIVGYGMSENSAQNGLEGEIYGLNMILASTIQRNHTTKTDSRYKQQLFTKNKVMNFDNQYIVLSDLNTAKTNDVFEKANEQNTQRNNLNFITPYSIIDHNVGVELLELDCFNHEKQKQKKIQRPIIHSYDNNREIPSHWNIQNNKKNRIKPKKSDKNENMPLQLSIEGSDTLLNFKNINNKENKNTSFWDYFGELESENNTSYIVPMKGYTNGNTLKLRGDNLTKYVEQESHENTNAQYDSSYWNIPDKSFNKNKIVSGSRSTDFQFISSTERTPFITEVETPPLSEHISKYAEYNKPSKQNDENNKLSAVKLDIETPPPMQQFNNAYGQWSATNFAHNVLKYIKDKNFHTSDVNKVPKTIPLSVISNSFPYASDFSNPLALKNKRSNFKNRRYKKRKREINNRETLLTQSHENELRKEILNSQLHNKPKMVIISSRGDNGREYNRFYRNTLENEESDESSIIELHSAPLKYNRYHIKHRIQTKPHIKPSSDINNSFLKSFEYFTHNGHKRKHDMDETYDDKDLSKNILSGNKWHNVKSYNNDYSPKIQNIKETVAIANKKTPSIRMNYKHDKNKINIQDNLEKEVLRARLLASVVAKQANSGTNIDSIFFKKRVSEGNNIVTSFLSKSMNNNTKNNFNRNIKLGNALNEVNLTGWSETKNDLNKLGGNNIVQDTNRYNSELDQFNNEKHISLRTRPKICLNTDYTAHVLYVQPEGSVDVTNIVSPLKSKNGGIVFVAQNYNRCSLEGSPLQNSPLILIDWNKTPVRLFGGAYPKKTKDLCGFF